MGIHKKLENFPKKADPGKKKVDKKRIDLFK